MTSTKPYMLRAFYEWIVDNAHTPYLLVQTDVGVNELVIPENLMGDSQIVFNISPVATEKMLMSNTLIEFRARFSGKPQDIMIPIDSVSAIYAKENGRGVFFDVEKEQQEKIESTSLKPAATSKIKKDISPVKSVSARKKTKKKADTSFLKVVK